MSARRLRAEILIVLAVTFGMSGLRSLLNLIDSLQQSPLAEQSIALNAPRSSLPWLDLGLQLCSAGVLFAWGALALLLLGPQPWIRLQRRDSWWGIGLAALIGLPGLGFYIAALHLGFSKEVVPSTLGHGVIEVIVLLLFAAANAFGEEVVVVGWFVTRLRQLGWPGWSVLVASAVLRGSYHLYQGISAGVGNIIMGLIFGYVFYRTGRIWPLILAHLLIDACAFLGYAALDGNLSWLGL